MGVMDYLKSAASSFIAPPKKPLRNPSKPDMYPDNATYRDLNRDGQDPMLKPKKSVNLFNPAKDVGNDISRNKHGHYVSTMTYPLPPLSWEKKQHDKNKKMRNAGNKYL